jgi:hypothetical protein
MLLIENINKLEGEIIRDMYIHSIDENDVVYIFELRSSDPANGIIKIVLHKEGFKNESGKTEYSLRIAYDSPIQFDLLISDIKDRNMLLLYIGKLIDEC